MRFWLYSLFLVWNCFLVQLARADDAAIDRASRPVNQEAFCETFAKHQAVLSRFDPMEIAPLTEAPQHWRKLAEEAYAQAQRFTDGRNRESMLRIAQFYEQLAERSKKNSKTE